MSLGKEIDIVDSVMQNSNNRNIPLENQGEGEGQRTQATNNQQSNDNMDNNNISNDNNKINNCNDSSQGAANNSDTMPENSEPVKPAGEPAKSTTQQPDPTEAPKKTQIPEYLRAIGMDPRKFWPKKYRFTREKSPGQYNPLTIAQRNFYEANGYLVMDHCVSQRLLDSMQTQYKQSTFVDEFLLDKLVAKNKKLLLYVKCFCDERLMLMTNRLVENFHMNETTKAIIDNKAATSGQQLFRDWIYLPFRPIDKVVCVVTAIDELNHVVLVVPGTHRVGQCSISSTLETVTAAYEASQESPQKSMARELYECAPENLSTLVEKSKKGFKYVNLKPGQTLFYHPGLIHGFSNDLINFRRRQLASIAYYAAADCEYIDYRKSSDLVRENPVPIGLSHFQDKHPSDYSSWIGKPRLLSQEETKANM